MQPFDTHSIGGVYTDPSGFSKPDGSCYCCRQRRHRASEPALSRVEGLTDWLFTGARFGGTISLYQMGARWYDPALGRWIQADTIVPEPGEPQALNRYSYVLNNPVIYTDPSGHYITLYGDPGVRYAGIWSQGQRELAVRMDEGQVFVLRGGTEFANVAEQGLANYYATGNEVTCLKPVVRSKEQ